LSVAGSGHTLDRDRLHELLSRASVEPELPGIALGSIVMNRLSVALAGAMLTTARTTRRVHAEVHGACRFVRYRDRHADLGRGSRLGEAAQLIRKVAPHIAMNYL